MGVKVVIQLHHCGRESYLLTKQKMAIGPSAVPSYIFGPLGAAAKRAVEAGFDAVELHGAHGYLLMQFLSAHSNKRIDKYGGDFKARSRFMIECIREVRAQVGKDFPISIRVSGEECIRDGYTIEDIQTIVPDLLKAGVDVIHASFGTHGNAKMGIDAPNPSAPVE